MCEGKICYFKCLSATSLHKSLDFCVGLLSCVYYPSVLLHTELHSVNVTCLSFGPFLLQCLIADSAKLFLTPLPDFLLRMRTSSFHHLCQRSSQSLGCRQGKTRAWTRLWTSSGKKPENGWWQPSVRRLYDRTPPRKVQTASKSTSPRPRRASESKPAPTVKENPDSLQTFSWHKHTHRPETNTQNRMHRGWFLKAALLTTGDTEYCRSSTCCCGTEIALTDV